MSSLKLVVSVRYIRFTITMSASPVTKSPAILVNPATVVQGYIRFILEACIPHEDWTTMPDFKREPLNDIMKKAVNPDDIKYYIDKISEHKSDVVAAFTDDSVDDSNNYEALEFLGDKVGAVVFLRYCEMITGIERIDQHLGSRLVIRFLSNSPSYGYIQGNALKNQASLWKLVSYVPDSSINNQELDIAGDVFESLLGLTYNIFSPDTNDTFNVFSYLYTANGLEEPIIEFAKDMENKDARQQLKEILRDRLHIDYDYVLMKSPDNPDSLIAQIVFRDSGFILEEVGGPGALDEFLSGPGSRVEVDAATDKSTAEYFADENAVRWLRENPVFDPYFDISRRRGEQQMQLYAQIGTAIDAYNKNVRTIDPSMQISRYTRTTRYVAGAKNVFVISMYLNNGAQAIVENTSRENAYKDLSATLQSMRNEAIKNKTKKVGPI